MAIKNSISGMYARAKKSGAKAKAKVYKTANGTRVMITSVSNGMGTAWVEKRYNKKTKGGIVNVVQKTMYQSSAKKYKK